MQFFSAFSSFCLWKVSGLWINTELYTRNFLQCHYFISLNKFKSQYLCAFFRFCIQIQFKFLIYGLILCSIINFLWNSFFSFPFLATDELVDFSFQVFFFFCFHCTSYGICKSDIIFMGFERKISLSFSAINFVNCSGSWTSDKTFKYIDWVALQNNLLNGCVQRI